MMAEVLGARGSVVLLTVGIVATVLCSTSERQGFWGQSTRRWGGEWVGPECAL